MVTRSPLARTARRRRSARAGFSLLEMVLSLAIFLSAMAVLTQFVWTGARASVQAQLRSEAVLRCESKLAELQAGVLGLQSASDVPYVDEPRWLWSATFLPTSYDGLLELKVTVRHAGTSNWNQVSVTLTSWLRDPDLLLEIQQAVPADDTTTSSSSSSTSASSSSSGAP